MVESDEAYFGDLPPEKAQIRKAPNRPKFGPHHKRPIVTLVERGGQARSFYAENAKVEKVAKFLRENVAKGSPRAHRHVERLKERRRTSPPMRRRTTSRRNTVAAT